jgi:hypothetical protein
MKRMAQGVGAVAIVLLGSGLALAQAPGGGGQANGANAAAAAPMNLQVMPKNSTRAQVIAQMNAFGASLGVGCNYCHVPGNFASDDNPIKKTARQMYQMRDAINLMMPSVTDKSVGAPSRVLCSTCHGGLPIPKEIREVVGDAEAKGGAAAGLAKYKELRAQFYGGRAYDFSENSLVQIAQRAQAAGHTENANAYLKANLEYFPNSSRTYQAMADVKNAGGDKSGAIQDLQKAVELDPNNGQAKNQLERLKGQ